MNKNHFAFLQLLIELLETCKYTFISLAGIIRILEFHLICLPVILVLASETKLESAVAAVLDVAMEMGTNHNYLSQYINSNLEMTFQIWLNTLRIEESTKILLSEEKLAIEEVGIKVGIPQNYNFSRWFRVVTDMTPFQYRRSHLSGK